MWCAYTISRRRSRGFCFFFSSRRRHTRFDCDWSSDVCSSDLGRVDRDLVVGLVSRLDPEIVVFQLDIEIGKNQLLADRPPDDPCHFVTVHLDRKSTRLNSSHSQISYAVFCLKKKNIKQTQLCT